MSLIYFFPCDQYIFFLILQTILFSTWEFELQTKFLIQCPSRNYHINTQPHLKFTSKLIGYSQGCLLLNIYLSVHLLSDTISFFFSIATFIPYSRKNGGLNITRAHPLVFGVERAMVTCWLWVERCSMALSASSGGLTLESPDAASLPTDWIWEWHVTFPDTIKWWLQRTFKCWCWKNHYLFSPWTASVILCSCIIFVMPRSLLWNNTLLRLACFQTSYLLKLEALR